MGITPLLPLPGKRSLLSSLPGTFPATGKLRTAFHTPRHSTSKSGWHCLCHHLASHRKWQRPDVNCRERASIHLSPAPWLERAPGWWVSCVCTQEPAVGCHSLMLPAQASFLLRVLTTCQLSALELDIAIVNEEVASLPLEILVLG